MNPNSLTTLPLAQLKRAVTLRERIESLETELVQLLGASAAASSRSSVSGHKNAARATFPQFRWSRRNGGRSMRPKSMSTGKRLSPSGRAKISAAVTARWERYRAAKAKPARAR